MAVMKRDHPWTPPPATSRAADLTHTCRGEVADAVVMDRKNYGFVTFAQPKDAMKFLDVSMRLWTTTNVTENGLGTHTNTTQLRQQPLCTSQHMLP